MLDDWSTTDMLVPEGFMTMRARELWGAIAVRLAREAPPTRRKRA
jgi:hypothetical protein